MENIINTSDRSEYKTNKEKLTHVVYNCYENNEMNKIKHKIEILGKINDQYKLLLLDTGASKTVIHKDTIQCNNIINKNNIYLETANNSKLNVLGSTMIKIEIGPIIIDHEAIIIDNLCSPILLGLDFMKRVRTILNLKDGLITFNFNNQEITLSLEYEKIKTDLNYVPHEEMSVFQTFLIQNLELKNFNCNYQEIVGDLFNDNSHEAIGHCVSKCLTMSNGIALQFRHKFNNVDFLIGQNKNVREIAAMKTKRQWIIYLITKQYYYEKPTYENIFATLQNLKTFCLINKINSLALPKICAGFDKKEWSIISNMLKFTFQHTSIKITIFMKSEIIYDTVKIIENNNDISAINNRIDLSLNNNTDPTLKKFILSQISCFKTIEEVPGDGDCGAHALRVCLREEGINISTPDILKIINIQNIKSGYHLTEDDLAYLTDRFDKNLTIIAKNREDDIITDTAIVYWKKYRPTIGILHDNNHWTPVIFEKGPQTINFYNICIFTKIPNINDIERNIDLYLHKRLDRLNLSLQNKSFKKSNDVVYCEICGINVGEYHNKDITKKNKELLDRHKKSDLHQLNFFKMTEIKNDRKTIDSHNFLDNQIMNENSNNNKQTFNIKQLFEITTNEIKSLKYKQEHHNNKSENILNINSLNSNKLQFDINPELTQFQQTQLQQILNRYNDCFAKHPMDLGKIDVGDVPIPTITTDTVNRPPYRLSLTEQNELQRQVNELLEAGLITHSISSYASPAFLVDKADGTKRLVIDYRQLNKQVPHQHFPITHIQTIFDCLEGAKYFNIMDMQQGFLNILLGTTDRHKLAFITPFGLYEWTRFPFGYKNSPRQFSKAVSKALAGLLYLGTINYVDDIINYAKTFEELLLVLEKLLQRIRETGFKLKVSKCKFGYFELKILGQLVNHNGIKPNPEGLAAIKNFPIPKTIKQTRSFLGLCNFFRKFIPRFAEVVSPITDLTRGHYPTKKSPVKWLKIHQSTFENIKELLTSPPLLKHFNPALPIIIWTDASKIGIAGTLLQKNEEDQQLHPISYISRRLKETEERYSAIELELLAIVYTLETFRPYVYGVTIEIWTDHAPLKYLDNIKSLSVKIQRLKSKLIDFDFIIKYRKGLLNQVCDAMSRNPVFDPPTLEQELQKDNELAICQVKTVNLQIEQHNDPIYNKIIQALENPNISDYIWIRKAKNYFLNHEKMLMYKHMTNGKLINLIALPNSRKNEIMSNFHDHPLSAHLGVDKTYKKIIERYFWPTMYKDIRQFVTSCLSCQKRKADKTPTHGKMLTSPKISGRPFERFTIDYIGPINPPSNGYSYILVGSCATTKYAIAKPYRNADAKSTVAFLIDVICQFGAVREIHSDRGLHFTSKLVKDLLKALNILSTNSIAYRPQSQGQTEKFNGTLIDMISHFVQQQTKTWHQYLKYVLFGYNSSVNETTNYSPFYLLHGYHPKSIFDYNFISTDTSPDILNELVQLNNIRDELPKLLEEKFIKNKKYYDLHKKMIKFQPGEKALVKVENKSSKFMYRYSGPFKIIRQISDVTYVVEIIKNGQIVNDYKHVSQLKKFKEREQKETS